MAAGDVLAILSQATRAGMAAILEAKRAGVSVEVKADASPVTEADRRSEAAVLAVLRRRLPGIPIVAEEEVAAGRVPPPADRFLLVDALDGTKEFVRGDPDYTVNVALIEAGVPVAGAVGAPETGIVHSGAIGHGAFREDASGRQAIRSRPAPASLVVAVSRSHMTLATERLLSRLAVARRVTAGSSLKFCLVAEGAADLYPRFGPTSEWDTAAGDAVLRAAGGATVTPGGGPFPYGKVDADGARALLNGDFLAVGDPALADRLAALLSARGAA